MKYANLVEERINRYLDDVASNLTLLSADEKKEILSSVRIDIDNELQIRGEDQPTLEDVEEVLSKMDPPASYWDRATSLSVDQPQARKISRLAIIGAMLLPFGFFLFLLFVPISASTTPTPPSTWQIVLRFTLLPLAVIAPFASTALGFASISQIRNSNKSIFGLPLAVFVSLFYPIIVLSLILAFVGWTFLGRIEGLSILPLAWFFLILVIDYLIIHFTWRAAKR